MKQYFSKKSSVKKAIALINSSLLALSSLNAQGWVEYEASAQTFSFSGTIKYAAEGTFEIDPETGKPDKNLPAWFSTQDTFDKNGNLTKTVYTEASVLKTQKYGNAEFLKEIQDDLLDGTTKGWSIVAIFDGVSGFDLVARKKNEEDVFVGTISLPGIGGFFGTFTDTISYTYNKNGELTSETNVVTGKFSYEGSVEVDLGSIFFMGIATETGKLYSWYPDSSDKSLQSYIYLSDGAKLTAGFSEFPYTTPTGDSYDAIYLVTGSLGKSSAVQIVSE